jgi:hypothetical protein
MFNWLKEWRELHECRSCDTLREQLSVSNRDRERLLSLLLEKNTPVPDSIPKEPPQPIKNPFVPWRLKQQQLEREDHILAEQKRAQLEKDVEFISEELGVKNAVK